MMSSTESSDKQNHRIFYGWFVLGTLKFSLCMTFGTLGFHFSGLFPDSFAESLCWLLSGPIWIQTSYYFRDYPDSTWLYAFGTYAKSLDGIPVLWDRCCYWCCYHKLRSKCNVCYAMVREEARDRCRDLQFRSTAGTVNCSTVVEFPNPFFGLEIGISDYGFDPLGDGFSTCLSGSSK